LLYIHRECFYESFGEIILKIGPYLPKLLSNIKNVAIYALDLVNYALRLVKRALDLVIYALDLSKHALDLVIYALDLIKHALDLINYVIDQVNYEEVYSPYMSSFKACMGVQMMYS